jgi:hypothetical protein
VPVDFPEGGHLRVFEPSGERGLLWHSATTFVVISLYFRKVEFIEE